MNCSANYRGVGTSSCRAVGIDLASLAKFFTLQHAYHYPDKNDLVDRSRTFRLRDAPDRYETEGWDSMRMNENGGKHLESNPRKDNEKTLP